MRLRSWAFALVLVTICSADVAGNEDLIAGQPGGPWRRLFLDAMVVEQQHGLTRVFHAAEKHPANPVLRHDRPWEGGQTRGGPYLYGTVMWDDGKLRMWYHCQHGGYRNCYAESTDGLTWTKPNLGLLEFDGSTENNLFLTVTQDPDEQPPYKNVGQCHNPSVIKRPWESDPSRRYVLFCYGVDYRHARAAFSPDGLSWTFVPETREKGLFGSGDVLTFSTIRTADDTWPRGRRAIVVDARQAWPRQATDFLGPSLSKGP